MNKETENSLKKYLKKFARQLEDLPKKQREEQLETIKSHLLEALADNSENESELEILKKAAQDFKFPKKPTTVKDYLISYAVLISVGIFLALLDNFLIYPQFNLSASIPYVILVLPGEIGFNLWKYFIGPHLPDKRFHLIYGWFYGIVLYFGTILVEMIVILPVIGDFEVKWILFLVYGIILSVFTVMSIITPRELMDKYCPHCLSLLPMESEFCLKCGEQLG